MEILEVPRFMVEAAEIYGWLRGLGELVEINRNDWDRPGEPIEVLATYRSPVLDGALETIAFSMERS